MRYPDGGGLSAEGQARREKLRLQAAQMFEQDVDPVQVAQLLRVSAKSAYQWRRRWRAVAEAAVVMPPTVSRPYPVDLLLCGHHCWVSRPRCGPRAPPSTTRRAHRSRPVPAITSIPATSLDTAAVPRP